MIVVPGSHLCNPTTGVSGWLAVPHGNQSHVSYPYSTFLNFVGWGGTGYEVKAHNSGPKWHIRVQVSISISSPIGIKCKNKPFSLSLLLTFAGSQKHLLEEAHHALCSLTAISLQGPKLLSKKVVKGLGADQELCQLPLSLGWQL